MKMRVVIDTNIWIRILLRAIDGKANIIVSGDDDLRGDETLRIAVKAYSIELLGVNSFLEAIDTRRHP